MQFIYILLNITWICCSSYTYYTSKIFK